ncbi:membrane protein [Coprinopsis cinerea AmutBmut pab1-1]|nr:membrane protein [Coprinopsis cinerea AmutBmut pab1-1]
MNSPIPSLVSFFLSFLALVLTVSPDRLLVRADPAVVPFRDCFDEPSNVDNQLNVSTVYAQVLKDEEENHYLNLTVVGSSPAEIVGLTNASTSLATLFTSTSVLTLNAWNNASYFCQTLRPPSPLPDVDAGVFTYCPIAPGPFAFAAMIPWGNNRELTTLNTRLRAVDPFGKELLCLDIATTPLAPTSSSIYGKANIILWSTVGLALAYWALVGIARIASAWNRGISRHTGKGIWSRAQSAGFILASAISGERLATSPALLRFCTPSMRDVIFHTQWCALLGMVAVEWPQFIYPLLTQTAWSTLAFNVSLVDNTSQYRWHPLTVPPYDPPAEFRDQMADIQSPLYIDPSAPNTLFTLPPNATHGISSFAYTLGIRPQDLFPTCMIIFLSIIAGTIVASTILWFIDVVVTNLVQKLNGQNSGFGPGNAINRLGGAKSPAFGANTESPPIGAPIDETKPLTNGFGLSKSQSGGLAGIATNLSGDRDIRDRGYTHRWWPWLRLRSDIGSFHGNVLHGNLVRLLVWFHLPVTVFSCYQMTLPKSVAGTTSISLAALSFVIVSILIPAHLVIRVTFTTTNKLYDETRTLLSLGPLYNHYRHGSQLFATLFFATNIAFGVTIGAGQKSGTAQAIVILVVEVISALVTSIWLPWGSGASMGLISFLFCVARIVVAVLLVILTPTISVGPGPGGWVSYGILIILALVYLALVLMLVVKLIEATVRIIGGIGFDRSRSAMDAGLLGACGLLGCGGKRRRKSRRKGRGARSTASRRTNLYKSELGESPASLAGGSSGVYGRRNSDLSSYNPPAAFLVGNESDRGSVTAPRFLGGADSRKGSTHSQPPSFLRPEHANQPYREEIDQDWWMENENQGGAFIMGAWQPASGEAGAVHVAEPSTMQNQSRFSPPQPMAASPAPAPTTSGFSRVGGGRAHIDSPYSITPSGNAHTASQASGSTHAFPSMGQASTTMLTTPSMSTQPSPSPKPYQRHPSPHSSLATSSHPPSSFYHPQYAQTPSSFITDDDEPPLPLSTVRQAAVASPVQHPHADMGDLPPGAMQPAHVRTKSQTAIVEDAGGLYAPIQGGSNGNSGSQSGISARLSLQNPLLPLKLSGHRNVSSSSSAGPSYHFSPPSAPAAARFTLSADDDDDDDGDSTVEDQQQKKKWYHLRKKRPHSSEGRTTTSASSSSVPLPLDSEFGGGGTGEGGGAGTPQRSFVVIRKPMGSMGRLNQPSSGVISGDQERSRPPTR